MKTAFFLTFSLFFASFAAVSAQEQEQERDTPDEKFRAAQIIVPLSLITAGAIITASPLNENTENFFAEHRGKPYRFDDFLKYSPHVAFLGFPLLGVEAKHDLWDRSILLGTSAAFVVSVVGVKNAVKHPRPDGSTKDAFPSGHTAIAFLGAELVRREYPAWCGALAYTVAGGVGFMRMYNQRHWIGDVVAGAGFGVLSVNAAYWLFPVQKRILSSRFGKRNENGETKISLNPYFDGERTGVFLSFSLR